MNPIRFMLIISALLFCIVTQPVAAQEPGVIAAGVPKYLVGDDPPDYQQIFTDLVASGITTFIPTFQYQELPLPLSLGYETDFLPPCDINDPAFAALRAAGMGLLVPGQLIYQRGNYPPVEQDPLARIGECAGPGVVTGILSIDEPFGAVSDPGDPYRDVRELYQRVKLINPDLPVYMVHAPIPAFIEEEDGTVRPVTQEEIDHYLQEVVSFSQWADVVGFDVYPVPPEVAGITAPGLHGQVADYRQAIPAYTDWLNVNIPGKEHFLVLQAFSFDHLYGEPGPPDPPTGARVPTAAEMHDMACLALLHGAAEIAWWGQSFLFDPAADSETWENVLQTSLLVHQGGCLIPGDLDSDGDVDQADLGIMLSCYQYDACGDIDGDGDTDQADLGILLANYTG